PLAIAVSRNERNLNRASDTALTLHGFLKDDIGKASQLVQAYAPESIFFPRFEVVHHGSYRYGKVSSQDVLGHTGCSRVAPIEIVNYRFDYRRLDPWDIAKQQPIGNELGLLHNDVALGVEPSHGCNKAKIQPGIFERGQNRR